MNFAARATCSSALVHSGHISARLWNLQAVRGEYIKCGTAETFHEKVRLYLPSGQGRTNRMGGILMLSKRSTYWVLSLFLAVPFLAASAPAAQYQGGGQGGPMRGGGPRGPMSPDDRLKQMTKDFNLTADQQTKIKPILVDAAEEDGGS